MLLGLAIVSQWRLVTRLVRRHWVLTAAMLVLALWAISNRVYLGPILVLSYPLPDALLTSVLAWFRASGRMFWPVAWLLVGLGIAGALRGRSARGAVIVAAVALLLQWQDVSIWRGRLRALVSAPGGSMFGSLAQSEAVGAEIARLGRVAVVPSVRCGAGSADDYEAPSARLAVEVQLLAGRGNAAMPSPMVVRGGADCAVERATPLTTLAGTGLLVPPSQPPEMDRNAEARRDFDCSVMAAGLICRPRR